MNPTRARNPRKGFTLVEMLITVGLFTIIVTIAVGGFTNALRTERQVSSLIATESNASLALEQMAREVRTGYLFCNAPGNTIAGNGVVGTAPSTADADCECTFSTAPAGSWTCNALDFYDAEGNHVIYSSPSGSATLVGNTVSIKYLQFQLFGQTEDDHWPPRVVISMGVVPSSTDSAISNDVFNLQTTVSARSIDCVPGTQQC